MVNFAGPYCKFGDFLFYLPGQTLLESRLQNILYGYMNIRHSCLIIFFSRYFKISHFRPPTFEIQKYGRVWFDSSLIYVLIPVATDDLLDVAKRIARTKILYLCVENMLKSSFYLVSLPGQTL